MFNLILQSANDIFKTITTDNGSEFADLSNLEKASNTLVYYAHTYTSCDKGTVERHNGLIRRFIPKGEAIANYSLQDIIRNLKDIEPDLLVFYNYQLS